MQDRPVKPVKDVRLVVRIDANFSEAIDELAFRRFEGDRSRLVRQAIRDMIDWEAQPTRHDDSDGKAA